MAQQRRPSFSDDSRSGEEPQVKYIKTQSHVVEHAVPCLDQGVLHHEAAAPKKRKRVARACMSCQKSHMSCGDERPCARCVDRGIAHTCCDGERKPRPHPGGGSSSSSHSAPKRMKHDDIKSHPRKHPSSTSKAHSMQHQQHLQQAAATLIHPHHLGMAVLPFAPVPSGPPSAMSPYASYYWQGTQNAPPTLEYHLTQELHQQVAPHPHQHHITLDPHQHAESLYARAPMHSASAYLMPQKLSAAPGSAYLTPTDATPATASTSTANTPDDSSSTATNTTVLSDGAAASSTKDSALPSAGTGLEHYDYYGGYAYGLPSAVVSGRYWDAANPALSMDYAAAPPSMYSMDFSYHQQAQMHQRPAGAAPTAAPGTAQPTSQSYYAMPARPPTYGGATTTGGSIQSQLI